MFNEMQADGETINDVEHGDEITFTLPEEVYRPEFKGEEVTGRVIDVWKGEDDNTHVDETTLNVKSDAHYQITADNFLRIEDKQEI